MKLCYRGIEYDYNPPSLEVTESELQGRYRGRPLHFSYVKHIPFPQPVAELTYRGVPYRTNANGQVEQISRPVATKSQFQTNRAANPMAEARRNLLKEAAVVHRQNVERTLRRRIEVAKSQGNDQLLHQLEAEMHQLV